MELSVNTLEIKTERDLIERTQTSYCFSSGRVAH
jgi:hypothetical protein